MVGLRASRLTANRCLGGGDRRRLSARLAGTADRARTEQQTGAIRRPDCAVQHEGQARPRLSAEPAVFEVRDERAVICEERLAIVRVDGWFAVTVIEIECHCCIPVIEDREKADMWYIRRPALAQATGNTQGCRGRCAIAP